jgi:hypothetical protein
VNHQRLKLFNWHVLHLGLLELRVAHTEPPAVAEPVVVELADAVRVRREQRLRPPGPLEVDRPNALLTSDVLSHGPASCSSAPCVRWRAAPRGADAFADTGNILKHDWEKPMSSGRVLRKTPNASYHGHGCVPGLAPAARSAAACAARGWTPLSRRRRPPPRRHRPPPRPRRPRPMPRPRRRALSLAARSARSPRP